MLDNTEKVSIVIPVYNVESYINQCVDSCLRQDYENIEILLIDDGSTDKSGLICDALAKESNTIRVFHKKNAGLSDARNYGVEHATGEYVTFIDPDDVVEGRLISMLYKGIKEYQCDVAVSGLTHFFDSDIPKYIYDSYFYYLNKEEAIKELLYQRSITTSSCAKIYHKNILSKNKFVKGQRFEDNDFLFRVFLSCEKVCLNKSLLYGYRHRPGSITTSKFSEKDFVIIEIGRNILDNSKTISADVYKAAVAYQITNCMRILLEITDDYLIDKRYLYCKNYISTYFIEVLKNKNVRFKVKIALVMIRSGIPKSTMKCIRNLGNRWK